MVTKLNLTSLKRPTDPNACEKTLKRVEQFKQAQDKLEKRCKQIGMEVPVMVC